jgi:type IV pilus assembly protein PilW
MKSRTAGFGLVELMIAMALGLLVLAGVLVIFLAQRQAYQNATSQALIQDADNALSAIITPVVRGAGFMGCSTIGNGVVTYIATHNTPLTFDTSSAVKGFEASSMPAKIVDGAANDTTASDWTPALDASFLTAAVGGVEQGSDVLVLIGAPPGASPVGTINFGAGLITVNDSSGITNAPQMVALSDCGKSSIFEINPAASNNLAYTLGPNGTPAYPSGSQVIQIQQTAFFVAKRKSSGQSALFRGVMTIPSGGSAANATWAISEILPGVINMQVLYGIGVNGQTTQYVDASAVTNWGAVTNVRLGFLIEGNATSSTAATNQTAFKLFNTALSVPTDSRLRHTYYMTVNTRNNTL